MSRTRTPAPTRARARRRGRPGVARVARRELRRVRSRGFYPLMLLALPVLLWVTLVGVFGARVARDLPVAVVDRDASSLSRRVARAVDATPTVRLVSADPGLDPEPLLRRGEVYAVLVLPRGLERSVLRGGDRPVTLLTNEQWLVPAGLIRRDVQAAVATLSVGVDARRHVAAGATPARARVAAWPIRTEIHPLFNPALDYAAFLLLALLPTLLHMFVLLVAVDAVGRELRHGTGPRWLRAAGGSVRRALLGKLAPYTAWFTVLGIALLEVSLRGLGLPVAGSRPLLYAAVALLVVAYQGVGVLLVATTGNLRLATTGASFLAGPAFAVVGVSFPLAAMPDAARAWAALLPLTHYLRVQVQQVIMGAPAAASLGAVAALAAFAAVPVAAAAPRLGARLLDPASWGRA